MGVSFVKQAALALALLAVTRAPAYAQAVNLLTNGTFAGTPEKIPNTGLSGWTNNLEYNSTTVYGYNFLINPAYANGTTNTPIPLWGNADNGINTITAPPGGGYFVAMDGAYEQGSLSQTLNNLVAGQTYYVSFQWAGAQQEGSNFNSITTDQFAVALLAGTAVLPGNATCATTGAQCTGVLTDAAHGFTGWNFAGFAFTATQAQETLSFLDIGTPSGEPPFALLADVSLYIPEPSSLALLGGVVGLLAVQRRTARKRA